MLSRLVPALFVAASAQAAELPPSSCPAPGYTPEMLRYEMDGAVKLAFALDKDGVPGDVRVLQASDYGLLDQAAIQQVRACRFAGVNAPASTLQTMTMTWRLPDGRPDVAPRFLPNTCLSRYKIFAPGKQANTVDYLTLRTQVWPDGQPYTAKVEHGSGDKDVDALAVSYVEQCRFVPAQRGHESFRGAALIKLPYDRGVLSEANLRATYEARATAIARQNQYRVAHILYANEDAATKALVAIQAGTPFGTVARRDSLDKPSGKVDGELGWINPSQMVPEFAGALRTQDTPGLVGKPVHTAFGWHLILVEDVRPATPPSYEAVRDLLRSRLMKETDIVVQSPPPVQR